jgi:hypothetical protein
MASSQFGRWLSLNWPQLYVKTGAAVWLGKAACETKESLDRYTDIHNADILSITGFSLLYYSPNVLLWPVNFAIDGYEWGVIKYYENKKSAH